MGNPEISDLQLSAPADQQVARLDVAVDQAGRVRRLQRSRGLRDQGHGPHWIQRARIQQPGERRPVHQFHHQVRSNRGVGLVVVVYLRDARMRQRACVPRLSAEPGQFYPLRGVPVAQ